MKNIIETLLPKEHWMLQPGINEPPMTFRTGTSNPDRKIWENYIREAARYAIRTTTDNGKIIDFDPDALVNNMIIGMLGYYTPTGLSDLEWE